MDLDNDRDLEEGDILSPDKEGTMGPPLGVPGGRGGTPLRKPRLRVGYGIGGFIARPRARGSLLKRMGMGRAGPSPAQDFQMGRFDGKL